MSTRNYRISPGSRRPVTVAPDTASPIRRSAREWRRGRRSRGGLREMRRGKLSPIGMIRKTLSPTTSLWRNQPYRAGNALGVQSFLAYPTLFPQRKISDRLHIACGWRPGWWYACRHTGTCAGHKARPALVAEVVSVATVLCGFPRRAAPAGRTWNRRCRIIARPVPIKFSCHNMCSRSTARTLRCQHA
jgi:uncharacterized protein YjiS (DUF1127 family)